jgi:hypothetical protein
LTGLGVGGRGRVGRAGADHRASAGARLRGPVDRGSRGLLAPSRLCQLVKLLADERRGELEHRAKVLGELASALRHPSVIEVQCSCQGIAVHSVVDEQAEQRTIGRVELARRVDQPLRGDTHHITYDSPPIGWRSSC